MYADISDPLTAPLYPSKPDSWDGKVKRVEWLRVNLTPGELAYLYKLSYDADGLRRDACDEKMKKEGWRP